MSSENSDAIERAVDDLRDDMVALIQSLVRVPSVTGQEGAAQQLVAEAMHEAGLEVDMWVPEAAQLRPYVGHVPDESDFTGRPNVVGVMRGSGDGRSLILNGHIDTVPAGDPDRWEHPPFAGEIADGRLYGRGACDMKAGLVAMIFAVRALSRAGIAPRGDVIVQSVIGEENGGTGTLACLLNGYRADAAIITEPTRLAIIPAQGGCAMFHLHVRGRTAHAAVRDEGVSAVEKFCFVLEGLREYERGRNDTLRHPLYDRIANKVPINVGTVQAGDWRSSVPDWLVAKGRAGLIPGEDLAEFQRDLERHLLAWCAKDPWLSEQPPRVEWLAEQFAPAEIPATSPLVDLVRDSFRQTTGRDAAIEAATYGADMRHFVNLWGIPTLMFGPGDVRLAHFTDEFVPLEEVFLATKVLALAVDAW